MQKQSARKMTTAQYVEYVKKQPKTVYFVYLSNDKKYVKLVKYEKGKQPKQITYQGRAYNYVPRMEYYNGSYANIPIGKNEYFLQSSKGLNYALREPTTITPNAKMSRPLNIQYQGKYVQKLAYNVSKPLTAEKVNSFCAKVSKDLYSKGVRGRLWIMANFNIGWRSSASYVIGDNSCEAYDPNNFDIYNNINGKIDFDEKIDEFYILYVEEAVKSTKGGVELNKYNDCLFNTLELSNIPIPKPIDSQPKLKRYLGLQRAELVDYRLIIDKIAPLYESNNVSISICGDYEHTPPTKNVNINIKLNESHYTLTNNENRKFTKGSRFSSVKYENVFFYYELENSNYFIYNGCLKKYINYEQLSQLKKDKSKLVFMGRYEDYSQEYKDFIEKRENLLRHSDGLIDLCKYSCDSLCAMDVWRRLSKAYNYSDPLGPTEASIISKAFKGGITHSDKGYSGYGICYDINSCYPATLINNFFQIPLKEGTPCKLTTEEFNNLKYYSYGIYRAKIQIGHDNINYKLFKTNFSNHYTHYDLTLAKELGFEISIIDDNEFNFYSYSKDKLIKSKILFGPFVEKLFKLKQDKVDGAKGIMNALWGALSARNRYKKIITDDTTITIPDAGEILNFTLTKKGIIKVNYNTNKDKLFKHDEGRMSCFFTSYTRMNVARQVLPYIDNIIRIQTDGIILNKDIDPKFTIGKEIGQWKLEYTGNIHINHINDIEYE